MFTSSAFLPSSPINFHFSVLLQSKEVGLQLQEDLMKVLNELYTVNQTDFLGIFSGRRKKRLTSPSLLLQQRPSPGTDKCLQPLQFEAACVRQPTEHHKSHFFTLSLYCFSSVRVGSTSQISHLNVHLLLAPVLVLKRISDIRIISKYAENLQSVVLCGLSVQKAAHSFSGGDPLCLFVPQLFQQNSSL